MREFKSVSHTQRFLPAGELIYQHTQLSRYKLLAAVRKQLMLEGIASWKEITGILVSKRA